jgi:superfamily II DNA/RNA helicase
MALLCPEPLPHSSPCWKRWDLMERTLEIGLPLEKAPAHVMEAVLESITPCQLQESMRAVLLSCGGDKPPTPLITCKAATFVARLCSYRAALPVPAELTAIVFVEQRLTALALHDLLTRLPCTSGALRSSPFMAEGPSLGAHGFSPTKQAAILRDFKAGALNCLVSTAVAEEGIDVRSCRLVARFDLPANPQSHLQSRGRARMPGSTLMVLVEEGNPTQEQVL